MNGRRSWMRPLVGGLVCAATVLLTARPAAGAAKHDATEAAGDAPAVPDRNGLADLLNQALQTIETGEPGSEVPPAQGVLDTPALEAEPSTDPPDIHVSPDGRVEMHVRHLELAKVLQLLSMESRRNIVATPRVTGTVTANLYSVTFEEALTAILASNGCTWREDGNFINVYTVEELQAAEDASMRLTSRLFRFHYVRAADAQAMVQPLLSKDGILSTSPEAEIGIQSTSEEAGGDHYAIEDCMLVIDYPENLEAVAKLVAEIDVRPRQVLIEATILSAELNEQNELGIDFTIVGGVDFQDLNAQSDAMTNITLNGLPPGDFDNTNWTGAQTDFAGQVSPGGLTFGIIKNNIAVFVRALEQVTDTTVLANPKLLVLNKQRGEVIVGRRDGYLTTTVTETTAIQSVEFLETGTRLIFRPFIGNDGHVRMEVHPEDSDGGLTADNLPFERTTELTTDITVRDGHTILIGGLFRDESSQARSQVPILGNIPIAGNLFRASDDNTTRQEVIILLTVHVVKDDDMLEQSVEAAEDVERFRVGMRQGLLAYGRERLAQAHYHWALEHLAKGHVSAALWDLELALNNNPKFLAAIRLKEEILGRRAWDDPGSSIRQFVIREIMTEKGAVVPDFGRPGPPFHFPALEGPNGFDDGDKDDLDASLVPDGDAHLRSPVAPGKGDS